MAKTNIKHLREIIEIHPEATEFLNAVEQELSDANDDARDWEKQCHSFESDCDDKDKEIERLESEIENLQVSDNQSFVGLDTIYWRLESGNLKIQTQVENFITALQKQNAVVPA